MLHNINIHTELVLGGGAPAFSASIATMKSGNVSRVAPHNNTLLTNFPAFYPIWAEAKTAPSGPWP
jgi:hypothetical protein